jgi:hypothetical protein
LDLQAQNEKVSGGPGVLTLGPRTYLVGQPDDRIFTTLMSWLQDKQAAEDSPIKKIADDLQYLTPEQQAVAMQKHIMTPEGASFLTWLLVRKEQPEVKLEDLSPHVTKDNFAEVLARLMTEGGLEAVIRGKRGRNGSKPGGPSAASTSTAGHSKNPKGD